VSARTIWAQKDCWLRQGTTQFGESTSTSKSRTWNAGFTKSMTRGQSASAKDTTMAMVWTWSRKTLKAPKFGSATTFTAYQKPSTDAKSAA